LCQTALNYLFTPAFLFEVTVMSVIPEAEHFLRTMPPAPQQVPEHDTVVEESTLLEGLSG